MSAGTSSPSPVCTPLLSTSVTQVSTSIRTPRLASSSCAAAASFSGSAGRLVTEHLNHASMRASTVRECDAHERRGCVLHRSARSRHEKLVAFSCKRRGFCPSCGARRMAETAAHLVEHVLPEQPIRQWVLSFPYLLRFLFATRPAVLSQVLGIVYRAISTFLIRRAGLRVGAGARTGAVTLIQRFGSALNLSLNVHLHMLFVDGVYTFDDERPRFHRGCAPTQPELQRLLRTIATRVTRALERQGLLIRDDETPLPRPRTRRRIRATPRCRRPLPHRHRPPRRAQGPDPAHRRVPPARRQPLHRSALGILPPCRHALPSPCPR